MLINLLWSALNMRAVAGLKETIRREFVPREECDLKHKICEDRHGEVCRRLDCIEHAIAARVRQ
jgi:hypothetical protein